MHVESRYAWITYSSERVWQRLDEMLRDGNTCCFIAYDAANNPIGFLLGALQRYLFARARSAELLYIYVKPDYRGGILGMKLIQGFRRWALQRDAVELHLGATFGLEIQKTHRLFSRLGFHIVGGHYSRWIDQEVQ